MASVPAGAGVIVNSNSKVEIFDNDIADNQTANLIISAYFSTNYYNKPGIDPNYDPYPRGIYIYDNRFAGGGDSPDGLDLKTLKVAMFGLNGHFPDILWDGYRDEKNLVNGLPPAEERICIRTATAGVLNADGPHKYKNPNTDKAAIPVRSAEAASGRAARQQLGRPDADVSSLVRRGAALSAALCWRVAAVGVRARATAGAFFRRRAGRGN